MLNIITMWLIIKFIFLNETKEIAEDLDTCSDHDEILYRESTNQMKISDTRIFYQ